MIKLKPEEERYLQAVQERLETADLIDGRDIELKYFFLAKLIQLEARLNKQEQDMNYMRDSNFYKS